MKSITKVTEFKSFEVELATALTGSIWTEFMESQKNIEKTPEGITPLFEEAEIIDEILDPKIDRLIIALINKFQADSQLTVEGYAEPEIQNIPVNENETRELNVVIKLTLQCRLPKLDFAAEEIIS